ncbi:uncharacterized protein TRAVEDRAFT_40523 [Trametes versicolor FP-101664 SS1]|uniref:uncharacterized protein n=1 Tax=Trametes versicolor (strain FP-101664) TaxID=717944 RepID=UPI0004622E6A|nr:uncharacterized protein TRAVEDRAFT_40523 [Trametes versicolor FP-101664 SS1]EIW52986.1 hypothetical protein TRAVEDRAFT_40523 [Trametes versicolor FP-101664 SS1]
MSDAKHHVGHRTKRDTLGTDAPLVVILIQAIQVATKGATLLPADVNLRNAVARNRGSHRRSQDGRCTDMGRRYRHARAMDHSRQLHS